MTQPYSIVSSTSALSIRILSSSGALSRSYSSRVDFRKLHHALPRSDCVFVFNKILCILYRVYQDGVLLVTYNPAGGGKKPDSFLLGQPP